MHRHPAPRHLDAFRHVGPVAQGQPGFVTGLPLGREAVVEFVFGHVSASFEIVDRAIEGGDEPGTPCGLGHEAVAMRGQPCGAVRARGVQHAGDLGEAHVELAQDQDLLQPQELVPPVVAVAVGAHVLGLEEPDRVVVMQRAHRHAGKTRQVIHHVAARGGMTSSHGLARRGAGPFDRSRIACAPSRRVRVNGVRPTASDGPCEARRLGDEGAAEARQPRAGRPGAGVGGGRRMRIHSPSRPGGPPGPMGREATSSKPAPR